MSYGFAIGGESIHVAGKKSHQLHLRMEGRDLLVQEVAVLKQQIKIESISLFALRVLQQRQVQLFVFFQELQRPIAALGFGFKPSNCFTSRGACFLQVIQFG